MLLPKANPLHFRSEVISIENCLRVKSHLYCQRPTFILHRTIDSRSLHWGGPGNNPVWFDSIPTHHLHLQSINFWILLLKKPKS